MKRKYKIVSEFVKDFRVGLVFMNRKIMISFFVLAFLLLVAKLSYGQNYQVNGNAINYGNGLVRLTSSVPPTPGAWQTSSAWSTTKVDLTQPFDMSFEMFFGCDNGPNGGDGMTFTFQSQGINAIGGGGGFLGIGGGPIISPAISIEFDTYDDEFFPGVVNEIAADHIAIDIDGNVNSTANTFMGTAGLTSVQAVVGGLDLESCIANANDLYTIRVVWDPIGKTLKLYEKGTL
ncbi:MAG TPA: L-type lectin-domain containing protein, partial [Cytophagaceae bacterium]|nr:L-type lectin-domain containing protein [Cytophagaceae bacterium]